MFDVGFTELVLIGLVALLVLGPTKMMEMARFAGRWAGRLRRQFNEVKEDIDRELQLEEMRRKLAAEEQALRQNLDVPMPTIDPMAELKAAVSEPMTTPASQPTAGNEPATAVPAAADSSATVAHTTTQQDRSS